MSKKLEVGKVPNSLLSSFLSQIPILDKDLVIPAAIGGDAAGLKVSDGYISITTDPITFASKESARYAVSVNVNDVACMGCRPAFFSSTILLPPGTTELELQKLWVSLLRELKHYQVQIIGGHMEVTKAVNTPIIVGQMIGKLVAKALYNVKNIQIGDQLLLWRGVAIEGTALIARERFDTLSDYIIPEQLAFMQSMITDPGICIYEGAKKLFDIEGIVALHDPTEGGVVTAIHELADAVDLGVKIENKSIPILSETRQLADLLKIDPLGLLASGSLLIVCKSNVVEKVLETFSREVVAHIGEFTEDKERLFVDIKKENAIPRFDQDEVIKALKAKL